MKFETYLETRNDLADNAAYKLITALTAENAPEWDMQYIGEIIDAAEEILTEAGIEICHPYYEGDAKLPCHLGTDCKNENCPFKKGDYV